MSLRARTTGLLSGTLLTLALAVAAPAAAEEQAMAAEEQAGKATEAYVNLLGPVTTAITPEYGMPTDTAEFTGNPASSLLSWLPEDLVLAPVPGYTPEFGWGLALVGGYFLNLDKSHPETPPSIIGAVGWHAENGSFAAGVGGKFNLFDDNIRVAIGGGYADVNYRFYGVGDDAGNRGLSVRVDQEVPGGYGSVEYQLFEDFYVGVGYLISQVNTSLKVDFDLLPPDFPELRFDRRIAAASIPVEYDSRDSQQYPRSGWHATARLLLFRKAVGSDVETETLSLSVNRYIPLRERDVLALRFATRATGKDAPFYLLSTFGGSTDLRGYESGRYRDRMMYSAQGEYRWQPLERWVFTAFAGVGEVAPSYSEFFSNFLPAGGAGVRFVLSRKHKLNLSFDVAAGKHGAEFYFGVGEAF